MYAIYTSAADAADADSATTDTLPPHHSPTLIHLVLYNHVITGFRSLHTLLMTMVCDVVQLFSTFETIFIFDEKSQFLRICIHTFTPIKVFYSISYAQGNKTSTNV